MKKLSPQQWEEASQHHLTVVAPVVGGTSLTDRMWTPPSAQSLADGAQGTWEIVVISSL